MHQLLLIIEVSAKNAPAQSGWRNDTWTFLHHEMCCGNSRIQSPWWASRKELTATNEGCPSAGGPLGRAPSLAPQAPLSHHGSFFHLPTVEGGEVGRGDLWSPSGFSDWLEPFKPERPRIFPITTLPRSPDQKDTHDPLLSPLQVFSSSSEHLLLYWWSFSTIAAPRNQRSLLFSKWWKKIQPCKDLDESENVKRNVEIYNRELQDDLNYIRVPKKSSPKEDVIWKVKWIWARGKAAMNLSLGEKESHLDKIIQWTKI